MRSHRTSAVSAGSRTDQPVVVGASSESTNPWIMPIICSGGSLSRQACASWRAVSSSGGCRNFADVIARKQCGSAYVGSSLIAPRRNCGAGRRRLCRAALGDKPSEIRQRFGIVGIDLAYLLIADDRLLGIHTQELTGFGQLLGHLVTRQPAGDRLSRQALPGGSSDEPAGQRRDRHRADDPGGDHPWSAPTALWELGMAGFDRPKHRRGARRVPVAKVS